METGEMVWPTCAAVLLSLAVIAKSPANQGTEQPFTSNSHYRPRSRRTDKTFFSNPIFFHASRITHHRMTPRPEASQPPARPESPDTPTRVALVEDNAAMRRNLERMLRRAPGLTCVCLCATAEEALEQVPPARPDVVLMDINLPGASGIECTARLKQLLPSLPVIMLTVYEDSESIF